MSAILSATGENVTDLRPTSPIALRARRHRQRGRARMRLLTVEMPEPAIEAAVARGLLKPEDRTEAWTVIQSA